jgi:hypothetical protein
MTVELLIVNSSKDVQVNSDIYINNNKNIYIQTFNPFKFFHPYNKSLHSIFLKNIENTKVAKTH